MARPVGRKNTRTLHVRIDDLSNQQTEQFRGAIPGSRLHPNAFRTVTPTGLVALLACGMRPNVGFFAVTQEGRTALIDGLMA
jgi:hypothetical protein